MMTELDDEHNHHHMLGIGVGQQFTQLMSLLSHRGAQSIVNLVHGRGFAGPLLNYQQTAFDLSMEPEPEPDRQETASPPSYPPPPKAPEGFTRSPTEEEYLICPNCNEELSVGDSDLKKQVWLVKACGHVSIALFPSVWLKIAVVLIFLPGVGLLRRMCPFPLHHEA
jgi:hypothetical protein